MRSGVQISVDAKTGVELGVSNGCVGLKLKILKWVEIEVGLGLELRWAQMGLKMVGF